MAWKNQINECVFLIDVSKWYQFDFDFNCEVIKQIEYHCMSIESYRVNSVTEDDCEFIRHIYISPTGVPTLYIIYFYSIF